MSDILSCVAFCVSWDGTVLESCKGVAVVCGLVVCNGLVVCSAAPRRPVAACERKMRDQACVCVREREENEGSSVCVCERERGK